MPGLLPTQVRGAVGALGGTGVYRWPISLFDFDFCQMLPACNVPRPGTIQLGMATLADTFVQLTGAVRAAARIAYPLAELNDLLTGASAEDIAALPQPSIDDPYRLNYVTAMVELAAHRAGIAPPLWTAGVEPLRAPVFIESSIALRAHLLTASPPPFRRRNIFIDSSLGDRV